MKLRIIGNEEKLALSVLSKIKLKMKELYEFVYCYCDLIWYNTFLRAVSSVG